MTKSELIARLASKFPQLNHTDADIAVNAILQAIAERLESGRRVEIRGFGTLKLNVRPPRMGRNPKTNEKVHVPSKAGVELRERINGIAASKEERLEA